ncbi:MAG: DJ-1/PfpI family protein [Alphaproteobacteria bacterium]|nr:DJ-1/PfpI family protein [Alphaproteobacteria bacterium]
MDIAVLIFDDLTPLDMVGPVEVLSRVPGARIRMVAKKPGAIRTQSGVMGIIADHGLAEITRADILLLPGGPGARAMAEDEAVLDWVRRIHPATRWTTSVCTGALILGGAGLLRGLKATTHWASMDRLAGYGATPVQERVVVQDKIITAAGVSSGIDMALALVARIAGEDRAKAIQLRIEYDPQPPFDAGSVAKAGPAIVALAR